MTAVTQRSAENIESSLSRSWRCVTDPSALVGATVAEHLRAMIYGASLPQKDHERSPDRPYDQAHGQCASNSRTHVAPPRTPGRHVRRTIGYARYLLRRSSRAWRRLEMPSILGKDSGLPRLYALSPRRLPDLPCCRSRSYPGGSANDRRRRRLRWRGAVRRNARSSNAGATAISPNPWMPGLGRCTPLAEWTAQILSAHEARMEVLQGLSADQLEVYAPDVLRSQRRPGRWIAVGQIGRPLDGVRLCQPQDRFARSYDKPHYLAHFEFRNGASVPGPLR